MKVNWLIHTLMYMEIGNKEEIKMAESMTGKLLADKS